MKKIITLIAVSMLCLAGCSDKDDDVNNPNETTTGNFEFLKVGNKWEYAEYNIDNGYTYLIRDYTTQVTFYDKWDDGSIFANVISICISDNIITGGSWEVDKYFWEIDKYGTRIDNPLEWNYWHLDGSLSGWRSAYGAIFFSKNMKVGNKVDLYYGSSELLATNVSVKVRAGTFNCFKLRAIENQTHYDFERIYYISSKNGIIKIEQYKKDKNGKITEQRMTELMSKNF